MATLRFLNGERADQVVVLQEGRRVIGKSRSADLPVRDPKVSFNQAAITADDGRYFIEDLKSRHGTKLNGELLEPRAKQEIPDGAVLVFGETEARFSLAGETVTPVEETESAAKAKPPDGKGEVSDARTRARARLATLRARRAKKKPAPSEPASRAAAKAPSPTAAPVAPEPKATLEPAAQAPEVAPEPTALGEAAPVEQAPAAAPAPAVSAEAPAAATEPATATGAAQVGASEEQDAVAAELRAKLEALERANAEKEAQLKELARAVEQAKVSVPAADTTPASPTVPASVEAGAITSPGEDSGAATPVASPAPFDPTAIGKVTPKPVPAVPQETMCLTPIDEDELDEGEPAPPPPIPYLYVYEGADQGMSWPLSAGAFTIGRGQHNAIILTDPGVSTTHAQIAHDGEQFVLKDLQSRNGCFVNNDRITEAAVAEGDVIGIGCDQLSIAWYSE
ncbi:FHA domain-containing protein [Planctomycetota bacterium]